MSGWRRRAQRARARAAGSRTLRKAAVRVLGRAWIGGRNASSWTAPEASLGPLAERYEGAFGLKPISYGTVADFAESAEWMPGLAGADFDMKDMQRCWAIKAVLGNVARGSRLVEIGAGEPLVAGILSRLGYEVVVVDPYDGSGNGPREYAAFKAAYPDVRFVREQFPPAESLGDGIDCVYSISVLEHLPLEAIDTAIAAARELTTPQGGCQIHAVDHVIAGWSAESHLEKLRRIVTAAGLSVGDLEKTIAELEADPETYFVSAEAHNRWRGDLPYEEYRMRRIASVNLFAQA